MASCKSECKVKMVKIDITGPYTFYVSPLSDDRWGVWEGHPGKENYSHAKDAIAGFKKRLEEKEDPMDGYVCSTTECPRCAHGEPVWEAKGIKWHFEVHYVGEPHQSTMSFKVKVECKRWAGVAT